MNVQFDFIVSVQTYLFSRMLADPTFRLKALEIQHAATLVSDSCLYDIDNAGSSKLPEKVKEFCNKWPNQPAWLKTERK